MTKSKLDLSEKFKKPRIRVVASSMPPPLTASLAWVENRFKVLEQRIDLLEKTLADNGIYL